ncbi:MAG: hypothetical protein EOP47_26590, partial [Sphingobacteriaceae bacterium]
LNEADDTAVVNYIPSANTIQQFFPSAQIHNYIPSTGPAIDQASKSITIWQAATGLIIIGSLFLLARLAMQFVSLKKIKNKAVIISDTDTTIYHIDDEMAPFSFGNSIYINKNLHTEKELEEIILHEYVHVRQRHTTDILLAEVLCIFNWYNPFAWLIRHSIRQNLEYIADDNVVRSGMDKKSYQYHLLKVVGIPQYTIANQFNFSSLKKRIIMMNSVKSAKVNVLRFLFILPLLSVMLLAFRDNTKEVIAIKSVPVLKAVNNTMSKPVFTDTNSKQTDSVYVQKFELSGDRAQDVNETGAKIFLGHATYKDSYLKVVANHIYMNGKLSDLKNAMVQIDGHPAGLKNIPAKVSTITILGLPNSQNIYGDKAKYGAIIVETVDNYDWPPQIDTTAAGKQLAIVKNSVNEVIKAHVNQPKVNMDTKADWENLKAEILQKVPSAPEELLMQREASFYAMYGQWASYTNAVTAYLAKYGSKAGRYDLIKFAGNILWGTDDKQDLTKPLEWANLSLEGGKIKDVGCMLVYGNLLYRNGQTDEAIAVLKEACEINGFKNPDITNSLTKMIKGEIPYTAT